MQHLQGACHSIYFTYTIIACKCICYDINARLKCTIFLPVYLFIAVSLVRRSDPAANRLLGGISRDYGRYLLRLQFF